MSETSEIFLDSVQGEIAFFRAVMHSRPIGIHRNFHIVSMRTSIHKDTGEWVNVDEIVRKLRSCYDVDALNAIDVEVEAYVMARSQKSTPTSIPSPSPTENLNSHPYFREEYALPFEPPFDGLIAARRMRQTPSPASSPAPSEPLKATKQPSRSKKNRSKSKANMAGLVGGDSDSSALTQESGDEALADSVATATDGETIDGDPDEEDVEMHEPSPGASTPNAMTVKSTRRRTGTSSRKRLRGAAAANAVRSAKKRKK
ncbi:hypothetical protein E1B28_012412 [Marasmius oreades]|uniref:Uncharacterized protein n=1 Tax=Marasmius oreades TaxID=181124 RepID=A0A9P7UNX9_9AGAR|nr:uncharacterized protein E1B28_012412 [Marasmius oreades]KAG7088415.1 hypothetical protein E1B28_012412 [Marasmius oreades]